MRFNDRYKALKVYEIEQYVFQAEQQVKSYKNTEFTIQTHVLSISFWLLVCPNYVLQHQR